MVVNTSFLLKPLTGTQRYAWELTKRLIKENFVKIIFLPKNIHPSYKKEGIDIFESIEKKLVKVSNYFIFEMYIGYVSKKQSLPLLNFTNTIPIISPSQSITTIHDVIPLFFSPSKTSYLYFKYYLKYKLKMQKKILTVSNFSKRKLEEIYNVRNVYVTYNGWDHILKFASNKIVEERKENIILYVSSFYPHKNHIELIKSFENVYRAGIKNWKLVLVGKKTKYFHNEIQGVINNLKSKNNIIVSNYLTDKELYRLFLKAKIFVFPSKYEGFGIPILEAMYFKNLIIANKLPVFEEIYRDSIFYYQNNLEKILYNFIKNYDNINREKIFNNYEKILKKYTWDECFRKFMIYSFL